MRLALSFGVGNTDKLFLSAITEAGARIIPTTVVVRSTAPKSEQQHLIREYETSKRQREPAERQRKAHLYSAFSRLLGFYFFKINRKLSS